MPSTPPLAPVSDSNSDAEEEEEEEEEERHRKKSPKSLLPSSAMAVRLIAKMEQGIDISVSTM